MKERLKFAIGVLAAVAFAYGMMPPAWYVPVWIMSGLTALLAILYGLFVYRKPLHGPADMAYLPSQAGQGSGSAHGDLQPVQPAAFDPSDHNLLDEGLAPASPGHPESAVPPVVHAGPAAIHMSASNLATGRSTRRSTGAESPRAVEEAWIATFRTQSDIVEILDDGYKWRRNGKKPVKNSRFPRSYYRCAAEGCSVKKRVQRDDEDPSYVIIPPTWGNITTRSPMLIADAIAPQAEVLHLAVEVQLQLFRDLIDQEREDPYFIYFL